MADIVYENVNISGQIRSYTKNFSYTDVASGESDSISLSLTDEDKKWIDAWMPEKGDRISADIRFRNWQKDDTEESFRCGSFTLDDLSFSGNPITCKIGAVSVPQNDDFNATKRTKTWEGVTVEGIASEIASKAGVALYYQAATISVDLLEQNEQEDCAFLYSVCQNYGLSMKVFSDKIVIYDTEAYEQSAPTATIDIKDADTSWSYNTTIKGTYTGATFSYSDPLNEEEYIIDIGSPGRMLNLNVDANNVWDAEKKGIAKLNAENKKITTMSITVFRREPIVASQVVAITGIGKLDGNYFVDKVKHTVDGSSAYKMVLTLHKVQPWIKSSSIRRVENALEEEKKKGIQYTIKKGDTLWALAKQFLGSGVRYKEIYDANADIIEAEARRRGKANSSNGHWIYPGTVITIYVDA